MFRICFAMITVAALLLPVTVHAAKESERAAAGKAQAMRHEFEKGISLFVPKAWKVSPRFVRNAEQLTAFDPAGKVQAVTLVTTENRRNHDEAVRRLIEIAGEYDTPAQVAVIAGWPAILHHYKAALPRPTEEEGENEGGGAAAGGTIAGGAGTQKEEITEHLTIAIAMGNKVVRLDTSLMPEANASFLKEAEAMGRNTALSMRANAAQTQKDIRILQDALKKKAFRQKTSAGMNAMPMPPSLAVLPKTRAGLATTSTVASVLAGLGELEIAISNDGQNVVVGKNGGYAYSTNGGGTFTAVPGGPPVPYSHDGDPTLAVGKSGTFYFALIGFPDGSAGAGGLTGVSIAMTASANGGATFGFLSNAAFCSSGSTHCFTDQEHIAADRVHTGSGGDQVYAVWRNFVYVGTTITSVTPSITCSQDSGNHWTAPAAIGAGDVARVATGPDGFVYATYSSGGNIELAKFSSCASGLIMQPGFPLVVSAYTHNCPVPGLDRCFVADDANPMPAVDDADPGHVFVAFANSTGSGNENVMVFESHNGGLTFPRSVQANSAVAGRRFLPWICAMPDSAYVGWYDRRAATAPGASNDLTNYYAAEVFDRNGSLLAAGETNLSVNADPQCASGWPAAPWSQNDSESCSVQPQLAGVCSDGSGRCDFSSGCASGAACQTGNGAPKYGDYNGNACHAGRVIHAWASATAPPGVTPPGAGISVYADTTQRIYFTNWNEVPGSLYKTSLGSITPEFTFSGPLAGQRLYHAAFNPGNSDLYVVDSNTYILYRVAPGSATPPTAVFTNNTYVRDVAFAPNGNLYFSEATGAGGDGHIYQLNTTTWTKTLFYTVHLSQVNGFWSGDFTFDPSGVLYLGTGNEIGAHIYRVDNPGAASAPVTVYSLPNEAITGIAFDAAGALYYANWDATNGYLYRLDLASSTRTLLQTLPGRMPWEILVR